MTVFVDWFFVVFFAVLTLLGIWLFGLLLPASLRAEAECLSRGYSKSSVTYRGDAYCVRQDQFGATHVVPLDLEK